MIGPLLYCVYYKKEFVDGLIKDKNMSSNFERGYNIDRFHFTSRCKDGCLFVGHFI